MLFSCTKEPQETHVVIPRSFFRVRIFAFLGSFEIFNDDKFVAIDVHNTSRISISVVD